MGKLILKNVANSGKPKSFLKDMAIPSKEYISKNNQAKYIRLIGNCSFDNTLCVETLHDKPKS